MKYQLTVTACFLLSMSSSAAIAEETSASPRAESDAEATALIQGSKVSMCGTDNNFGAGIQPCPLFPNYVRVCETRTPTSFKSKAKALLIDTSYQIFYGGDQSSSVVVVDGVYAWPDPSGASFFDGIGDESGFQKVSGHWFTVPEKFGGAPIATYIPRDWSNHCRNRIGKFFGSSNYSIANIHHPSQSFV